MDSSTTDKQTTTVQAKRTSFCKICKDSGKPEADYTSHNVRLRGVVTCPVLLATICPRCKEVGHMSSYCPSRSSAPRRVAPRLTPTPPDDDFIEVRRRGRHQPDDNRQRGDKRQRGGRHQHDDKRQRGGRHQHDDKRQHVAKILPEVPDPDAEALVNKFSGLAVDETAEAPVPNLPRQYACASRPTTPPTKKSYGSLFTTTPISWASDDDDK
jgi:hypothetical protein